MCPDSSYYCGNCGVRLPLREGHWVQACLGFGKYRIYCASCALLCAEYGPEAEAWQDAVQDVLKREKRGLTTSLDTIETTLGQRN